MDKEEGAAVRRRRADIRFKEITTEGNITGISVLFFGKRLSLLNHSNLRD